MKLVKEELEKYFYYDESSKSCLKWAVDICAGEYKTSLNVAAGSDVGSWSQSKSAASSGAFITSLNKKRFKVHRIIYQLFYGDLEDREFIDHIDGDPRNNKISNLRKVTHRENMKNVKKRRDNTFGAVGVEFYDRPGRSPYFIASWKDEDGKKVTKSFAISVHGKEGALIKASEARTCAINKIGGYTNRHGR